MSHIKRKKQRHARQVAEIVPIIDVEPIPSLDVMLEMGVSDPGALEALAAQFGIDRGSVDEKIVALEHLKRANLAA